VFVRFKRTRLFRVLAETERVSDLCLLIVRHSEQAG